MFQSEEIREITKKMNKLFDSPIAQVVKRSGKSRPTVSKFFNHQPIRPSGSELIYDVCLELIEEKENKKQSSLKKGNKLNKPKVPLTQTAMKL